MESLSWPRLLTLLDRDIDSALTEFYGFVMHVLTRRPPGPMRSLCKEQREDFVHDLFLHCVRDNFRVLRQYTDTGKPFVAWLYAIAYNLCIDEIRKKRSHPELAVDQEDNARKSLKDIIPDPVANTEEGLKYSRYLVIVEKMLSKLGDYCRLLLKMVAEEYTIKEMVVALGLPPEQNKKVSDDLRYCRKKLEKKMRDAGYDIRDLLPC